MGRRKITKEDFVQRVVNREFKDTCEQQWVVGTKENKRARQLRRMKTFDLFPIAYPEIERQLLERKIKRKAPRITPKTPRLKR